MNLLIVSSEAVPFVKTGGLGDVAGTLALELSRKGHQVTLILPYHREIKENFDNLKVVISPLSVPMGNTTMQCQVLELISPDNLRVLFIEYNDFFDRHPIYDDGDNEYPDNGTRFAFFSKACLDAILQLQIKPDIIHCNDWQTSLIPFFLKCWAWEQDFFRDTASLMSIHNLGYQGMVDIGLAPFIGLKEKQVRQDEFEALGGLNLLKGALFYADQVATVSPTYAREILSEPGGWGLSPYLQRRQNDIIGILNGIDLEEWNPATDPYLPQTYNRENLEGKRACKLKLQEYFKFPISMETPIFGIVGRMADQKGLDLLQGCLEEILGWELRLVILGSGDPKLEKFFQDLPKKYPTKVGTYVGFQSNLAHLIEAGSDFFIMPSLYEPCGLNQMYSMLYGTVPVVRATGGLNDTVQNFDPISHEGTGFVFQDYRAEALKDSIGWALDTWYNQPKAYKKLQKEGMGRDFSWDKAINEYEGAYKKAITRKRSW
ncbi:MAG: glycogen synthase [SAR324 cluster bacterium]|uniref:Glycogen synthase n=1 Tax=SAR324 cluster bacterium TaxID=2024889 RepID=A0A2A4T2E2_9DELT|nr:MAG: glycogen synthase [SAR324 cluster bacterium]